MTSPQLRSRPNRRQPAGDASPARILRAARELSLASVRLTFRAPVAYVYHPLSYAWVAHESYVSRYASGPKRVLFLGMNPGPFGMMQTGVPFGEVEAVRDWLGISADVEPPPRWHPKRPVEGFACARSEVSGRRLWGLFRSRFGTAERFFADHFVANYCPLAFLDEGGRNLTPDQFPAAETKSLFAACDAHLRELVTVLRPQWVIGVGDFAGKRARLVLDAEGVPGARSTGLRLGRVLHPSPASPAANRDWAGAATRQLEALGVW